MQHPQIPHQYNPGQQGDGDHHDGGRGVGGHQLFPRSLSHQDMMAGRVLSEMTDMASSTENLANFAAMDNNNVKFSHEVDHAQAQLHHQQLAAAGGRMRTPFPPAPKLSQMPDLPRLETPPVMPLPVSSAPHVYPPASGFGTIASINHPASHAPAQQQVKTNSSVNVYLLLFILFYPLLSTEFF